MGKQSREEQKCAEYKVQNVMLSRVSCAQREGHQGVSEGKRTCAGSVSVSCCV